MEPIILYTLNKPAIGYQYFKCDAILEDGRRVLLSLAEENVKFVTEKKFYAITRPGRFQTSDDSVCGEIRLDSNGKIYDTASFKIDKKVLDAFYEADIVSVADAVGSPKKKRRLSLQCSVTDIEEREKLRRMIAKDTHSDKVVEIKEWKNMDESIINKCVDGEDVLIRNLDVDIYQKRTSLFVTRESSVIKEHEDGERVVKLIGAKYFEELGISRLLIGGGAGVEYRFEGRFPEDALMKDVKVEVQGKTIISLEVVDQPEDKDNQAGNPK